MWKPNHELIIALTQLQKILPLVQDDKDLLKKYADIYLRVSTARKLVSDARKDYQELFKSEEEKYRASLPEISMEDLTKELEEFFAD